MTTVLWRGLNGMALGLIMALTVSPALAQPAASPTPAEATHLGVASCAGSTCHGAVQRLKGSYVPQNEYIIWSRHDKHARAYADLGSPLGERIARNLGLADARKADVCLECHADDVPQNLRGPEFQISDGVGCEACHGGAKNWLGVHISGATHAENLAAGLYPTEDPRARAKLCLSCHFGDKKRFVTHEMMGAGHPRMSFELDTFTAAEPAHFVVDKQYVARKGPVNDVQIWAVGQAMSLVSYMNAVTDPKHAPHGLFPELVLFDCTACHHGMSRLRWQAQPDVGLPPGTPLFNDANAVMLRIIAARVAPDAARTLSVEMRALHQATTRNWAHVVRMARAVRTTANMLADAFAHHDFDRADMRALAAGLVAAGLDHNIATYPEAEQATMAFSSIFAGMRLNRSISAPQAAAINRSLNGLYGALASNAAYEPDRFVAALRNLQATLAQVQPASGP